MYMVDMLNDESTRLKAMNPSPIITINSPKKLLAVARFNIVGKLNCR